MTCKRGWSSGTTTATQRIRPSNAFDLAERFAIEQVRVNKWGTRLLAIPVSIDHTVLPWKPVAPAINKGRDEMTVIPEESEENVRASDSALVEEDREQSTATPVLVTEQQVRFSTAADGTVQPARTAHRLTDAFRVVVTALHRLVEAPTHERSKRRVVPPRSRSYYETSLVSRERLRL